MQSFAQGSFDCPICSSSSKTLFQWGGYGHHSLNAIAGISVELTRQPFTLLRCPVCSFTMKMPRLDQSALLELYQKSVDRVASANPAYHSINNPVKRVMSFAEQVASGLVSGRRVLEIGCSNGFFLSSWSSEWHKYGVEPSSASSLMAEARGIHILGQTIEHVPSNWRFDCIVSIDVIEHVSNPSSFLSCAQKYLSKDGIIIIMTGDCSYWLAHLAKARYWYASFPEHISFLNPRSMRYLASRIGGRVILSKSYAWDLPKHGSCFMWCLQLLKYSIVFVVSMIMHLMRLEPRRAFRGYPVMTSHQDHRITVIGDFT